MSTIDSEQALIRQYLLGLLDDEDRQRLEERVMVNPEYCEEVRIVEEELLEKYLDNNLSTTEKEQVQTYWHSTPEQDRRLKFADALNRHCASLQPALSGSVANIAGKRRYYRPANFAWAAVFIVILLGGLWLIFNLGTQRRDFNRRLTYLNSREGDAIKPDLTVPLSPLTFRGSEVPRISPPAANQTIELVLPLPPEQYASYQVILTTSTSDKYSVSGLNPVINNGGHEISFKTPGALLIPGEYAIEVRGRAANGAFESVADYNLRVSN